MRFSTTAIRRFAASATALSVLLLTGCITVENDDADPIIPAASFAYPLKIGTARECDAKGANCGKVEFMRREGGGYVLRRFETNLLGLAVVKDQPFKMRLLQGAGIPADTYLVQPIAKDPNDRNLTILTRQPAGRWLEFGPTCDKLIIGGYMDLVRRVWNDEEGGQHCVLKREGLTDQRLYTTLRAANDADYSGLFIEGA
jgi:hypothetical protein